MADCINPIKLDAGCTCVSLWEGFTCNEVTCFIFSIVCQVTNSEPATAGHFTAGTNRGHPFAPLPITSAEHVPCVLVDREDDRASVCSQCEGEHTHAGAAMQALGLFFTFQKA